MKKSEFLKTMLVPLYDKNGPMSMINLDIHRIDGGIIGIESSFAENVGNYIPNPFDESSFVFLSDPESDDDPDPPLEEDDLYGFLKIVKAVDDLQSDSLVDVQKISDLTGLDSDRLEVLFGLARQSLDELSHTGENGKVS